MVSVGSDHFSTYCILYVTLVVCGLGLGVASLFLTGDAEIADWLLRTGLAADIFSQALENSFDDFSDAIHFASNHFTLNPNTTYQEFLSLVEIIESDPLNAKSRRHLAWVPEVTVDSFEYYETLGSASYQDVPGVKFTFRNKSRIQEDVDIPLLNVSAGSHIYPSLYVFPVSASDSLLGYNLGDDEQRNELIQKASKSKHVVASTSIPALMDGKPAIIFVQKIPHTALVKTQSFIYGSLSISPYISDVLSTLVNLFQVSFVLCDVTEHPSNGTFIYASINAMNMTLLNSSLAAFGEDAGIQKLTPLPNCSITCNSIQLCVSRNIRVADRLWELRLVRIDSLDYTVSVSMFILVVSISLILVHVIRNTVRQLKRVQKLLEIETEATLLANKGRLEAEKAFKSKMMFLNTMSHELKTPMVLTLV
jgi:hypothetical protein